VRVLITDCGSTTTKALLFEEAEGVWTLIGQADAPTTVEPPVSNVTVGVLNAVRELEEISHRQLLTDTSKRTRESSHRPFLPTSGRDGIDLFISTSSAGGGLQMIVTGLARQLSAHSAQRAALGAGAIVLDVVCNDDGRSDYERIETLRTLKPDILLMSGGTEGGAREQLTDMAELVRAAAPEPRFGASLKLPCLFAGNSKVAEEVGKLLSSTTDFHNVPNIRPALEKEDIFPAREAIHELFLSHVMSHSPGYKELLSWCDKPIEPTPNAAGRVIETYAREMNKQVLCVDIGGATTDIFSLCRSSYGALVYNRSVSANLGMSYSAGYVLKEAGLKGIAQWLPFSIDSEELIHLLRNKMVRPTTIPHDLTDLLVEQSLAREALRLSLRHHRSLAVGLGGAIKKNTIGSIFSQRTPSSLLSLRELDMIIGSGGVISHAPTPMSALAILLDGFQPEGITELSVDSIFMLPHLGMLTHVSGDGARVLLESTCLSTLGTVVAPLWSKAKDGAFLGSVEIDGTITEINEGRVYCLMVKPHQSYTLVCVPNRGVDFGAGYGESFEKQVQSGACGVIIDARGRPLSLDGALKEQQERQKRVYDALGLMS
jgi:uncharacterized protein (TIGR01319 family)